MHCLGWYQGSKSRIVLSDERQYPSLHTGTIQYSKLKSRKDAGEKWY